MKRLGKLFGWSQGLVPDALVEGYAGHPVDGHQRVRRKDGIEEPARNYEPPRLIVIGSIHALTTGSSSSGKKDANSQYYW